MRLLFTIMLSWTLAHASSQEEATTGPSESLASYEELRIDLVGRFDTGMLPLVTNQARILLERVLEDEAVPLWYRSEIQGLTEGFETLEALAPDSRQELLEALAQDPDPADGPGLAEQVLLGALATLEAYLPAGHPSIARRLFYLSSLAGQAVVGRRNEAVKSQRNPRIPQEMIRVAHLSEEVGMITRHKQLGPRLDAFADRWFVFLGGAS